MVFFDFVHSLYQNFSIFLDLLIVLIALFLQSNTLTLCYRAWRATKQWSLNALACLCLLPLCLGVFWQHIGRHHPERDWKLSDSASSFESLLPRHHSICQSRNILLPHPFLKVTKLRTLRLTSTTHSQTDLWFTSPWSVIRTSLSQQQAQSEVGPHLASWENLVIPATDSDHMTPHPEHQQLLLQLCTSHRKSSTSMTFWQLVAGKMFSFIKTQLATRRYHEKEPQHNF